MLYDINITPAAIKALAAWVYDGDDAADVELAVDDRMLVAEQGDEKMAWDTDGSPGSDEYVSLAPLDPTGRGRYDSALIDRLRQVHEASQGKGDQGAFDVWNVVAREIDDYTAKGGV